MSRIGKKPILIPDKVEVKVEGQTISVKGPLGELKKEFQPEVRIEAKEKNVFVSSYRETKRTSALWGLTRALIFNMVEGVTKGYSKKLQIEGVGYKARIEGNDLILQMGFSHPVKIQQPEGIKFLVEKNIITISGPDKELVGQIAAEIRAVKPPEPYKGKGIRYVGEVVRRKAGKKVVAAGS
jgi:large subunit ribosomal protein L6